MGRGGDEALVFVVMRDGTVGKGECSQKQPQPRRRGGRADEAQELPSREQGRLR